MSDTEEEREFHGGGIKGHIISEPDLAELERVLPDLMKDMAFMSMPMAGKPGMTARHRVQWINVMNIVQAIRWDGGPPLAVGIIPAGPEL